MEEKMDARSKKRFGTLRTPFALIFIAAFVAFITYFVIQAMMPGIAKADPAREGMHASGGGKKVKKEDQKEVPSTDWRRRIKKEKKDRPMLALIALPDKQAFVPDSGKGDVSLVYDVHAHVVHDGVIAIAGKPTKTGLKIAAASGE
jgi:hypothetical protein